MVFYQIQQAGNEEYQSKKKWNSAAGIEAVGSNGTVAVMNSASSELFSYISRICCFCYNFWFLIILTLVIALVSIFFVISLALSRI